MKKSKTYYKITPKRLRECLEKIWRWLRCSWNGFYYIENQYWETTDVEFYHWDRKENQDISEINIKYCFWNDIEWNKWSFLWSCVFVIKWCKLISDTTHLCIMVKENKTANQPAFISFYNHNNK